MICLKALGRITFFLLADIGLLVLAVWLSMSLRFSGQVPEFYQEQGPIFLVLVLGICLPLFWMQRLYHFHWSLVGIKELAAVLRAVTYSFIVIGVLFFVFWYQPILGHLRPTPFFRSFPRSVVIIDYVLSLALIMGLRGSRRIFARTGYQKTGQPCLIVGAQEAGIQILESILKNNNDYKPVGFIAEEQARKNTLVYGLPVLGLVPDLPQIIKEYAVVRIIIALPQAKASLIRKAVSFSRQAGIKQIKVLPSLSELILEQVDLRSLRDVRLEDLLGRDPVSIDTNLIAQFIRDKRILITGAAGSIGTELSRQVAKFKPQKMILLDQEETGCFHLENLMQAEFPHVQAECLIADICHKKKIENIFARFQPQIVFHAAAYKHVPLMERHPEEAVRNNILGTWIVARAALKQRAENFVFISTDKAVNPVSVMGASKRVAEMLIVYLNQIGQTKFNAVRFGNILGSRGSVVPLFKEQIKRGGPITITHPKMKRYFMIPSEAVLLVMEAGAMGQGGQVFVLDMGEPVKIIKLAREMVRLCGYEPDKDIPLIFTGLRPGERLYENYLTAEEGTMATRYEKILVAKISPSVSKNLIKRIQELLESAGSYDAGQIKAKLKQIVPQYEPKS